MPRKSLDYLTRRQKEIVEFIEEFRGSEGISPTHREICEHFGYSSYGTVYKHLKLLERKGYLQRDEHQKRGIQLVRSVPGRALTGLQEVPFLGMIAAGKPIEALSGDETLSVPPHLLTSEREDHYVLRVVGESMIEEGIFDGDFVVVQRRDQAEAGEMVVALIGSDATLKRFFPEGDRIRLQPANPSMEPMIVPAVDVRVQGIVVGMMRKF